MLRLKCGILFIVTVSFVHTPRKCQMWTFNIKCDGFNWMFYYIKIICFSLKTNKNAKDDTFAPFCFMLGMC